MKSILVCYFTRHGSTREAAAVMHAYLTEKGFDAEILPLDRVGSLDRYETVVIGAPINGMKWVPEAVSFVEARQKELKQKRTAVFCLSYIYFTGGNFWKKAIEKALDPAAKKTGAIKTGIFGGRIDDSLPAPMRAIFGIPKDAPLSLFDPAPLKAWIAELAGSPGS